MSINSTNLSIQALPDDVLLEIGAHLAPKDTSSFLQSNIVSREPAKPIQATIAEFSEKIPEYCDARKKYMEENGPMLEKTRAERIEIRTLMQELISQEKQIPYYDVLSVICYAGLSVAVYFAISALAASALSQILLPIGIVLMLPVVLTILMNIRDMGPKFKIIDIDKELQWKLRDLSFDFTNKAFKKCYSKHIQPYSSFYKARFHQNDSEAANNLRKLILSWV